jgi:hypothetical protein
LIERGDLRTHAGVAWGLDGSKLAENNTTAKHTKQEHALMTCGNAHLDP